LGIAPSPTFQGREYREGFNHLGLLTVAVANPAALGDRTTTDPATPSSAAATYLCMRCAPNNAAF